MNSRCCKIEFLAIALTVALAAVGFGYWLMAPYWREPAAEVSSNVASEQAKVLTPQPRITEPTGPPPLVSPNGDDSSGSTYAPPTGQPSNGQ